MTDSLVYTLAVNICTAEKLTEAHKDELALAVVEALRVKGVSFFVEDGHNEIVTIRFARSLVEVRTC